MFEAATNTTSVPFGNACRILNLVCLTKDFDSQVILDQERSFLSMRSKVRL